MVGVRGGTNKRCSRRPEPARIRTTTTPMMAHLRQAGVFGCVPVVVGGAPAMPTFPFDTVSEVCIPENEGCGGCW